MASLKNDDLPRVRFIPAWTRKMRRRNKHRTSLVLSPPLEILFNQLRRLNGCRYFRLQQRGKDTCPRAALTHGLGYVVHPTGDTTRDVRQDRQASLAPPRNRGAGRQA